MDHRQTRVTGAIIAALREACRAAGAVPPPGLDVSYVDTAALRRAEVELLTRAQRLCVEELDAVGDLALPVLADSLDEAVLWMHNTLGGSMGLQDHELRSTGMPYRVLRAALALLHSGVPEGAGALGVIEVNMLDAAKDVFYRREVD